MEAKSLQRLQYINLVTGLNFGFLEYLSFTRSTGSDSYRQVDLDFLLHSYEYDDLHIPAIEKHRAHDMQICYYLYNVSTNT